MTCEILISISLGDNFPLKDDYLLKECKTNAILEAKFNDELLQSDPIEIDSANPELATELGFRINRKDFHQFRTERKSIKLQCFVEYSTQPSNERHFIGYVVLHLRDAQDYTTEPKYKWVVLLNAKYKGSSNKRPQLYLALMVNKNENDTTIGDGGGNHLETSTSSIMESSSINQFSRSIKKEGKSYFIDSIMSIYSSDFNSNLAIEITNKCVYIWNKNICDKDDCLQIFTIHIHMNRPKNLVNLLPTTNHDESESSMNKQQYFFRYVLFGKQIKTNSFSDIDDCQDFNIHKYSVNLRTFNKEMLQEYFESYPTIEIQFCSSNNELIGFVTINLLKLFQQNNAFIHGNFVIVPEEESVYVKDPFPVINLRLFMLNQNKNETFVERPIDFINHYYIAIDLRTIRLSYTNNDNVCQILFQPFYLQFSYAFFGATEPIKTYPSIRFSRETPEQEITIPHGFCGFNLATTCEKLFYTFENLPLIIQLILDEDNTLLGTSEINLKCLLKKSQTIENDGDNNDDDDDDQQQQQQQPSINESGSIIDNNGTLNDNFVQIEAAVYDELSDQICEMQIIMFIQELFDTVHNNNDDDNNDHTSSSAFIQSQQIKKQSISNHRLQSTIAQQKRTTNPSSKSSIMTQSLYGNNEFNESMKPKQSMDLIEKERQLDLLMKKLDERERILFEQEKILDRKQKEIENNSKFMNPDSDLESVLKKVQCDYEEKINQLKIKNNSLEQEKFRYQEKNYQLERKWKEKMARIRELEAKVFELTQLNKRKQSDHQSSSNNNQPRRIVIQRDFHPENIESNLNKMSITNMKTSNLPVRSKSITRPLCGGQQQQQPSTSKENF
ncbi:hypothetical protein DERF_014457 [Dermatophagoides farinae]|uniref:Duf3668 domain-containing protein n=1 Tax=Dermatophagoides farinae TaxID=6954 RepID=A0A922KUD3_DERFA|nr:centrosomal protein of 120 kDa-like [Dermatophagoides farinae]KAH7644344.1 duf3668 domain-containing protein [Dermatophagoides farinae]KAH9493721.1 hypothetical protein DERF_014457 [Dermatophagoides farinae]